MRQALPSAAGDIAVFENVLGEESLNLDYPFGALVRRLPTGGQALSLSLSLSTPDERAKRTNARAG